MIGTKNCVEIVRSDGGNMRRIDKAFEVFNGRARCEIVPNCCPYQIDQSLPDVDGDTFKTSDSLNGPGCRGITCEECWDQKINEVKNEEY